MEQGVWKTKVFATIKAVMQSAAKHLARHH